MRGCGKGITFCEYSAIDTDYLIDVAEVEDRSFAWKMSHKGARAQVSCEEENKPTMIAIWAVDHMFCSEIIHGFELKTGESQPVDADLGVRSGFIVRCPVNNWFIEVISKTGVLILPHESLCFLY